MNKTMNTPNANARLDVHALLATGATKWIQRIYKITLTATDLLNAQKQMNNQNKDIDNVLILKIDYDSSTSIATITDMVRTCC
jgi:hypothetical protein